MPQLYLNYTFHNTPYYTPIARPTTTLPGQIIQALPLAQHAAIAHRLPPNSMKLYSGEHRFIHPWHLVSAANWTKYPHELTSHVTHVDYLSRTIDPKTGVLRTVRLITCQQSVPEFILRWVGASPEAYVYEVSEVNPKTQSLTLKAKNLTFSEMMTVQESCQYTPLSDTETLLKQEVQITSLNGLSYLRNKLEDVCMERFRANASKGKMALEDALKRLLMETKEAVASVREPFEKMVEETKEAVASVREPFEKIVEETNEAMAKCSGAGE